MSTASWATIGPPSSVSSTRWTVAPVTATPAREGIADRVGARERRQERRVGVEDPPGVSGEDRRPDDPHVAREDDDIRRGSGQGLGHGIVGAARDDGGVDPLLRRPVDRRARPVRDDEHDVSAELAARRGRVERPQVAAGARDRDRDPALTRGHPPRSAPRPAGRPSRPRPPAPPRRRSPGASPIVASIAAGCDDDDHPEARR